MAAEARFAAMGSEAHVVICGGRAHLPDEARSRVRDLEKRWSRFLPDSELSMVNARPGALTLVSPETFTLLEHAVEAWNLTGGAYDPTLLDVLERIGYDRDFGQLDADPDRSLGPHAAARAAEGDLAESGCASIVLVPEVRGVLLPGGVAVDPGGIGKGLAADIVTAELLAAGAAGAMVNLGGDLRVRGEPPEGNGWSIGVPDPLEPTRKMLRLAIADGAVATSSRLKRRWLQDGVARHHLIDPRTSAPVAGNVVAVTVVASHGWLAEVATKQVFVTGTAPDGVLVAVVSADSSVRMSPELEVLAA